MRFFGVQIGFTVLVALVYRKLGKEYSLAHWLLTNGNLYIYFASLISILEQGEQKNKSKKNENTNLESISSNLNFTVEKIRQVKLFKQKLSYTFIHKADYFEDFTTQIDACLLALLVSVFTQILFYISPSSQETQINLALFWLLGLLLNLVYRSSKILLIYFTETLSYELSLCIFFGLIYFLLAFVILSIPSTRQELNIGELETSLFLIFEDFNVTKHPTTELQSNYDVYIRFIISLFSAFVGMALLFPSNRIAKCHTRRIQMYHNSFPSYLWYQLVFWLPIIPCIFWIPITGREMLAEGSHGIIDIQTFIIIRKICFPLVVCIRLISFQAYLQAFLERPNDILNSLQAKNSRINGLLLYSTLVLPNSYISMVAIQCTVLPCFVLCFTMLAWFLSAFSTASYTCLFHLCVFYSWWCCMTSMMSSVIALLYQNYIESKD
ncbi:putative membrane protein [Oopsacas minuta]|uniref:Membrane protein n=1 Tax=Oopsacas minuta TaxID=111878 RepID=A0AAV7K844_9METZ|nr:putative membrane protein [Oopsacas minuta]